MPILRAAAEIDPLSRIASSSAIFPGPMRSPFSRSMRIDRRVPAMAVDSPMGPNGGVRGSDADAPSIVKLIGASMDSGTRQPAPADTLYSIGYFEDCKEA